MEQKQQIAKHAVIVCHPDEQSFNMAVAETYCAAVRRHGQTAILRDLYRMNFDPVLKAHERPTVADFRMSEDVAAEIDLIAGSDVFVLIYPIWFGTPPAMLKGYVERVLGAGFPHGAIRTHTPNPLLGGKRLLSFTSSGSTKQWLAEQGAWVSLQTVFDGYLARAFWMETPEHIHFDSIVDGLKERFVREYLHQVEEKALAMCSAVRHPQLTPPRLNVTP